MQILVVSTPILTALSINYISSDQGEAGYGFLLFLFTFFSMTLNRMFSTHLNYRLGNLGISMANTVTMMIFNKSLKYSELGNKDFSEAEILNYSQVDAERLVTIGLQLATFFYGPLLFIIGLVFLYFILGITFLVAVAIIALIIGISYVISRIISKINKKIFGAKDERMKTTKEMLDIVRFIKISTIEKYFYTKLS